MGGSGSGGWSPSAPRDPCDTLAFRAALNSPQAAVLTAVTVGHVLDVVLSPPPQQVVSVLHMGAVAGVLTGPRVPSLIRCLQNGYLFEAEVEALNGGDCTVGVRSK
jgi:hypothetical protein